MTIETLSLIMIGAMLAGAALLAFVIWDARRTRGANSKPSDALPETLSRVAGPTLSHPPKPRGLS